MSLFSRITPAAVRDTLARALADVMDEQGAFAAERIAAEAESFEDPTGDVQAYTTEIAEPRVVDNYDKAARVAYSRGASKGVLKVDRYPDRPLETVNAVMLHQPGVVRSPESLERTAHRFTCHALVAAGVIYRNYPLTTRLIAGHGADRLCRCVHIEVAGNYRGTPDGRYWQPDRMGMSVLDPATADALEHCVVMFMGEVEDAGGQLEYLWNHRQFSKSRAIDPGFEIAREGERIRRLHGLSNEGGRARGGLADPESWRVPA